MSARPEAGSSRTGLHERKLTTASLLALVSMVLLIVSSVLAANVTHTTSDPWGSLLLSQIMYQRHTVQLDAYPKVKQRYGYRVHEKNGHTYYYFPIGTSLFSVPFVAIANREPRSSSSGRQFRTATR